MGFKDEKVERALRHTNDFRIEALLDYLMPELGEDGFSLQWNH
jgi:hypothetical protein